MEENKKIEKERDKATSFGAGTVTFSDRNSELQEREVFWVSDYGESFMEPAASPIDETPFSPTQEQPFRDQRIKTEQSARSIYFSAVMSVGQLRRNLRLG